MKLLMLGALLVGAAGMLSGCATMSPEECMVADWYRIGEQDARAGRGTDYLANRASDCAEAGYPADTEAWHAGFDYGLGYFCTLDSGLSIGSINSLFAEFQQYPEPCPAGVLTPFQPAVVRISPDSPLS